MRTVLQRVSRAAVRVEGRVVGEIGRGVVLLAGIAKGDTEDDVRATARKVSKLRIFPGRTPMDRTLADVGGACLVVSQFTLLGALAKGNRPGFGHAEDPSRAEQLVAVLVEALRAEGLPVETGAFGAMMEVELVNDGPVTFVLDVAEGRVAS